jgi:hypothetical protein
LIKESISSETLQTENKWLKVQKRKYLILTRNIRNQKKALPRVGRSGGQQSFISGI